MKRWFWVIAFLLSIGLNLGWAGHRLWLGQRSAVEDELLEELDRSGEDRPDAARPEAARLLERMANDLRLRGETRRAFLSLQRQYFEQAIAGRRALGELQHRARREILRRQPNREVIDALLLEINETQLRLEQGFVDHLFACREILDPPRQRRFLRWMGRWRQYRPGRQWPPQGEAGSRAWPGLGEVPERGGHPDDGGQGAEEGGDE